MKNGGWVRWRHWTANGMVAFGQMPLRDVGRELQKFEAEAIKILKETGADHVLYGVKEYDAIITRIDMNHEDSNKSFVIQVTDPELIDTTGGIVQGMSGSPVLQNGKVVGAITHVFVQDAASGYGIFIENMLDT